MQCIQSPHIPPVCCVPYAGDLVLDPNCQGMQGINNEPCHMGVAIILITELCTSPIQCPWISFHKSEAAQTWIFFFSINFKILLLKHSYDWMINLYGVCINVICQCHLLKIFTTYPLQQIFPCELHWTNNSHWKQFVCPIPNLASCLL